MNPQEQVECLELTQKALKDGLLAATRLLAVRDYARDVIASKHYNRQKKANATDVLHLIGADIPSKTESD